MASQTPTKQSVAGSSSAVRLNPSEKRLRISLAFAIALSIVGAAWFIGGRQGFGEIGKGGVNTKLLPKVGQLAPDFTTYDVDGNVVKLSDFKGQPVWLNFWGSWCPPCRSEMPDVQAAYQQLAPKGIVLLAISLDESPQKAAEFAQKNKATFTILSDPNRENTGGSYPILNFPTHIFIASTGVVQRVVLSDLSTEEALQFGNELIALSDQR
jgi:peroxiredoxin